MSGSVIVVVTLAVLATIVTLAVVFVAARIRMEEIRNGVERDRKSTRRSQS